MPRLFFTDMATGRVRFIDQTGPRRLRVLGRKSFLAPTGPSVGPHNRFAVADSQAATVWTWDSGHIGWSGFAPADPTHAFVEPTATAYRGTRLLVLDSGAHRLVAMDDLSGTGWTEYGRAPVPADGGLPPGTFVAPRGLAVDTTDRIWITDPAAGRVIRIDDETGTGWLQPALPPSAEPSRPFSIAAHGAGVALIDAGTRRLVVLDAAGQVSETADLTGAEWAAPCWVASLGAPGSGSELAIADMEANSIRIVSLAAGSLTIERELRGSPPDRLTRYFDRIGGACA